LAVGLKMAICGRYLVLFRDLADAGTSGSSVLHGARHLPRLL
jgi:hypothetical protein